MEEVHPFPNPSPSRTFPPRSVHNDCRFDTVSWTERGGNFFFLGGLIFILWLTCFCFCEKSYLGELSASNHDFLLPRESHSFGRGFRVAGTCGAAEPRLLYRESFQLQTTRCLYREKVTFSIEDLGWRYLNPRGSNSAVCRRDFPIQADVTVKQKTVAKLL